MKIKQAKQNPAILPPAPVVKVTKAQAHQAFSVLVPLLTTPRTLQEMDAIRNCAVIVHSAIEQLP